MTDQPSAVTNQTNLYGKMKRRRALPVASAAAAATALSLAGCGLMPGGGGGATASPTLPETPASQPATTPSLTAKQKAAEQLVQSYTNNFEMTLDQIDRERLKAGQRKIAEANQANQTKAPIPTNTPAETPIISAPPAPPAPTAPTASTPALASQPTQVNTVSISITSQTPPATAPIAQSPVILAYAGAASPTPAPTVRILPTNKPETPAAAVPAVAGATALSNNNVSSDIITPIAKPTASVPSAMGAMTAVASPEKTEIALPPPAPAPTIKTEDAPTPAPLAITPTQEPSLEQALAIVRKRAAEHPSLNTALALALLNADPQTKPEDLAKTLPDSDQKVFTDLLSALERMNSPAVATATLADRAAPLVQAAEKWQADADLALPRLVLATRVDSFGVYTNIEPKFEQGKRQTVIIYCEVSNFSSKKSDDGWFTTSLTQQETLITDDGLMVWRPNAEEVEDKSLNQRRDFYLVKKLTIPETLAAGKYTLRMKVTDRNSGKSQNVGLTLEITGK